MSSLGQRSPIRQIKTGHAKSAIFVTHGLGGRMQGAELAKQIHTEHPIFAIDSKGIDGQDDPLDRVEDMAAFYLTALNQDASAQEPCVEHRSHTRILVGYSFGGLVAFEMAQRLLERGEPVARLILVDAFPHAQFLALSERVPLFAKRMFLHAHQMWNMPRSGARAYFTKGIKRRLHLTQTRSGTLDQPDTPTSALSGKEAILQRVREKSFAAYASYRPKFYPGKISFIATEEKTFFPSDPAKIWQPLCAEFELTTIPGHHLNILTSGSGALASAVTRYIQEATS